MRAWVVDEPGGPQALRMRSVPDPVAEPGQVCIQIEAFGLNRAEVVTRSGGSGSAVVFPRVLGIECVGTVIDAPATDLDTGQTVAAVMNGMGRAYDGSYAERTVVPRAAVVPLDTSLGWSELAALPETFLTAWGCLDTALRFEQATVPRIVMRPAASALGRAVNQIVMRAGGTSVGITRSPEKADTLRDAGFAHVIVSDGPVADEVRAIWPDGATGIIDTVTSSATITDDLAMRARRGRVCIAGSLAASSGEGHERPGLAVAAALARPSVTRFSSETLNEANSTAILQRIVDRVEAGEYHAGIDTIVSFEHLDRAHASIEANAHCGKLVVAHDRARRPDSEAP